MSDDMAKTVADQVAEILAAAGVKWVHGKGIEQKHTLHMMAQDDVCSHKYDGPAAVRR